jgi:hypothetical protein
MLEVQDSSPVVGEVFGHLTSCASCPRTNIASHGNIEGISANDMMNMSRWVRSWLDDRIKALDSKS